MEKLIGVLCVVNMVTGQLAFPEMDLESNNMARVPLYAPRNCKDPNEFLYPGNQQNDWICDCKPGYVYYPLKNGCFGLLREGPCNPGEHLILEKGKLIPECAKNPCKDGYARFKEECYELGKPNGPCAPELEGGGIFDVHPKTLELDCVKGMDQISILYASREKMNYRKAPRKH